MKKSVFYLLIVVVVVLLGFVACKKEGHVAVIDITLDISVATLNPGGIFTLSATVEPSNATDQVVTWTSSNMLIATVDNTGKVTAIAPGSTTITVTTQDGSKTSSCDVIIAYFVSGSATWSPSNVDNYQTFASRPDMYTKFYQWNRPTAWTATDQYVTGWPNAPIVDLSWTINPCPSGWRLPTAEEWTALGNTGNSWADANARGNAVNGHFFGPNHTTCSLPSNMAGCIFLPAVGFRVQDGSFLFNQGFAGYYWTPVALCWGDHLGSIYFFSDTGNPELFCTPKAYGYNIRCVK